MEGPSDPTYEKLRVIFERFADRSNITVTEHHELMEEISVMVEELNQADEQLQLQYEELLSARQRLEDERRHYQELFDFAPDAYLVTDSNGLIQEANRAAGKLLNVRNDFLAGKPMTLFVSRLDWQKLFSLLVQKQQINDLEIQVQPRDMPALFASATLAVTYNAFQEPYGIRWMVRDISMRKQVEAELDEMRRRLQGSGEAERLRLAQEIHDGPMQELYGLVFQLETLPGDFAGGKGDQALTGMKEKLLQVIQSLRTISRELRPPALAPYGLEKAIHSHVEYLQQAHPDLKISVRLDKDAQALPENVRMTLFRIYQTAITNVIRHAQASQAEINFQLLKDKARLEIRDNGCGFTVPRRWIELARQGHMGLVGAAERAEAAGGKLDVESAPGKGTLIRVQVPRDPNGISASK